jgi:hypothetical protein
VNGSLDVPDAIDKSARFVLVVLLIGLYVCESGDLLVLGTDDDRVFEDALFPAAQAL